MSTNEHKPRLTLFLWVEGFFPKQIVYQLLIKGLADSTAQIYDGKTNDPNLNISRAAWDGKSIADVDPSDPKPAGKSSPCLRVVYPDASSACKPPAISTGNTIYIEESSSIMAFLEEMYPKACSLTSPTALERAWMQDIRAPVLQFFVDGNYYIKHAASVTTAWSGLQDKDRSLVVARRAREDMQSNLLKAQIRAAKSLDQGGWLTPGLEHPGLVDIILAAGMRYMGLSYSMEFFKDDKMEPLRKWYKRFQSLPWWDELEETGRHPEAMRYPPSCCEV